MLRSHTGAFLVPINDSQEIYAHLNVSSAGWHYLSGHGRSNLGCMLNFASF